MELEKGFIVRTDFSSVRRGYDQEEVDRHLREIAQAVEALKRASQQQEAASPGSLASTAAEQVRTIVEAAERSAAEIEANATEEADRVTGEAAREAEQERDAARGEADRVRREAEEAANEIRERAETEAAAHVSGVRDATESMRTRADAVESDLGGLVEQLRTTVESLVEGVRTSAESLESELSGIHADLAEVREARPIAEPEDTLAAEEPEAEAEPGQAQAIHPDAADDLTAERTVAEGHDEPAEEATANDEAAGIADEAELEEVDDAAEADLVPEPEPAASGRGESAEGARLIALNMALNGTPRDETARYLEENFDLEDQNAILDEVYARVGG